MWYGRLNIGAHRVSFKVFHGVGEGLMEVYMLYRQCGRHRLTIVIFSGTFFQGSLDGSREKGRGTYFKLAVKGAR